MIITKTYKDIKPVLMQVSKIKVKEPYYLIKADEQVIFVVSPGQNGVEYNKTEVFFSNYEGIQTYQCLYGQGVMLMQRNDEKGEAKEFKVVTLTLGKQVVVPAFWAMCLVNIGKSFLVILGNNVDVNGIKKQSLAYFVIEKKGEVAFEQNPNYSVHPQITTE